MLYDFSNWYVRRSRRRLWDDATNDDKRACQHTQYEVLSLVCKLTAPVAPFMVDEIYSNLNGDSVHLSNWPIQEDDALPPQDFILESKMS